jgi:hypothetical protein
MTFIIVPRDSLSTEGRGENTRGSHCRPSTALRMTCPSTALRMTCPSTALRMTMRALRMTMRALRDDNASTQDDNAGRTRTKRREPTESTAVPCAVHRSF